MKKVTIMMFISINDELVKKICSYFPLHIIQQNNKENTTKIKQRENLKM